MIVVSLSMYTLVSIKAVANQANLGLQQSVGTTHQARRTTSKTSIFINIPESLQPENFERNYFNLNMYVLSILLQKLKLYRSLN